MRKSKNGLRRIAALICSAALVATLLPAQVLATGEVPEAPETTQNEPGPEETGDDSAEKDQTTVVDSEKEPEPAGQDVSPEGQDTETNGDIQKEEEAGETEENPANPDGNTPDGNEQAENTEDKSSQQDSTNPSADSGEKVPAGPSKVKQNTLEVPIDTLADAPVAQIGGDTYETLDAAVEAAAEGSTIKLLQDCELTQGFDKTLTFTGGHKITINKQLTNIGESWMCFGWGDSSRVLTFDGVEVEWNSEVGTSPWLMLSLSGTMNVTNGAKVSFTVDSGASGNRNAIYMNAGSSINVTNGSTFIIKGNQTKGKEGQGLQLDQAGKAQVNVKGNSTFIIDGTNRGYVNSPSIYVENSTFTVQNCTANASNGGNFKAVNSTVTYQNNTGHGLSADDVILENTHFNAIDNGYYGLKAGGKFQIDSTSVVTIRGNSDGGDYAALKLSSGVKDGKVKAGAVVTITDNYCSGLSNNGKVVFEEGVKLTITGNTNNKGGSSYGAGVYNTQPTANLTLPSDAIIYNNHAKTGGDDIYNTGTITFGRTGSDWKLDGDQKTIISSNDCTDAIDGWYDDSKNARWSVHDANTYHAVKLTDFKDEAKTVTLTGTKSLKAAHSETATLKPADITIYMGGDNGYDGVTDANGTILTNNSLPEPGYYITLPEDVNTALQSAGYVDANNTPVDLSEQISIRTIGANGDHNWSLHKYGNSYSEALGKYIYAIAPVGNTQPLRLTFTDGDTVIDQDFFEPSEEQTLQTEYQMNVYSELVDAGQVFLEVKVSTGNTYFCKVTTESGTLNVRYVTGDQDSVVTPVYDSIEAASEADDPEKEALDKAYVIRDPDTKFYINGSDVDVTESEEYAHVSLLFDDVISEDNTEGVSDYSTQLIGKAVQAAATDLVNVKTQAKYLDLVDANNGNVWLKPSESVTVYWPYPAGTDASTDFRLVHFVGLDRDMGTGEVAGQIASTPATTVELKKDEYGISFTTNTFSPFVLVWGDKPVEQVSTEQPAQTPAPTAAPTPAPTAVPTPAPTTAPAVIPQTGDTMPVGLLGGVAVVAVAAFVVLLVLRKRKHDD